MANNLQTIVDSMVSMMVSLLPTALGVIGVVVGLRIALNLFISLVHGDDEPEWEARNQFQEIAGVSGWWDDDDHYHYIRSDSTLNDYLDWDRSHAWDDVEEDYQDDWDY